MYLHGWASHLGFRNCYFSRKIPFQGQGHKDLGSRPEENQQDGAASSCGLPRSAMPTQVTE